MLSLRILGRYAPRSALRPLSIRQLSSFSRNTSLRPTWQSIKKPAYRAFSTSVMRREPAADQVLSEKLKAEKQMELGTRDTSQLPEELTEFLDTGSWKIEDKPGTHEVALSKEFGNEQIKVEFSILDLTEGIEDQEELDEDNALADEGFEEEAKQAINQSGVKGGKIDVVAEDSISPADRGEVDGTTPPMTPEYPMRLHITITKPGNKTVQILATSQDGAVSIDNIQHGLSSTSGPDNIYSGPSMTSLDPDLQVMLEQYLEERGIDANLANFAFAYNDYKEQREYVDWLQQLQDFVDT